jgi:hypothetical protein
MAFGSFRIARNSGSIEENVGSSAAAQERLGAGDRDRTDDIQLGKLTFYH